jgi:hypothetical protein
MKDIVPSKGENSNAVTQILNTETKDLMKGIGLKEIGRNAKYYDPKHQFSNRVNFRVAKDVYLYVMRGYKTSV